MQFITHQSHNDYHLALSLSFPCFLLSLLICAAPSLPALSTNSPSLPSLYGDFPSSVSALLSLSLSLVVSVGRGDHSMAFRALLLSGGSNNDGRNEGWRNGGVKGGKRRDGVLFHNGCQRLH